ncbi:LacI family DNA-binding transcriptional regulator [Kineococcus rhizosphaerae]|uniref:LacI family transcriptional regulator n=1 Tax=Kineococcus rhizosphaerae TaxID=559628 RepID=A0A2T0R6I1_9ACTN|nr:LacI family DNA-binding transcriptional regulator [Kineococcus rhizosphaerae]PRY16776.1 LacI family transcriptional regulator [Kineococcus rhizosphaerae]
MTAEQQEDAPRRARRTLRVGATIEHVAAAAGVSRQTVTRAMNDMDGISAATKGRVLAAAKELNYRPSRFGRGLARAAHDTLGLVVPDLANPYAPEFAAATVRYAGELGWNVVLVDTSHARDPGRILSDLAGQVDAVLGYLGDSAHWAEALAGMPVVAVDPGAGGKTPDSHLVRLDPRPALREAAEHLATAGVRHVVVLDGDGEHRTSDRARLIADALTARGLSAEFCNAGGQEVEAGRAAARRIVAAGLPDAVFAWNDILAVGALSTFTELGVRVPDQVRLLGIDGLSLGTFVTPQLTTLAADRHLVARHAVDLAIAALGPDAPAEPGSRRVEHVFTPRASA